MNLMLLKLWAKSKLGKLVKDEKGEVNIVAIVILVGIAVVLAIIFKDAIMDLINDLLGQITDNTSGIFDYTTP